MPSLIVLAAGIGSLLAVKWYFGLAGMVLGALCLGLVVFATMVAGTFSTARDYKAMVRAYGYCVLKGMSRHEAISEVSRLRHPEVSAEVHDVLAHKLADIDKLFFLYDTGIEPGRRRLVSDSDVLSTLYASEVCHLRAGIYRAHVDHAKEAGLRERLSKAEALRETGDCCQQDTGLDKYDEAIAVAPEYIVAHVHRAHVLTSAHRFEDAVRGYDDALRLCPDLEVAWEAKGDCYAAQKRFKEAAPHYARAVTLHATDGRLRVKLSKAQNLSDDYEGALATLTDECCLGDPEAWLVKGRALFGLKRWADAVRCFARATELSPGNPEVWKEMGDLLIFLWRFDEAQKATDEVLRLSPTDPEAWEMKGSLHESMAIAASALQTMFRETTALGEDVHQETFRLATALGVDVPSEMNPPAPEVTIDHLRSAQRFYQKAVELDPCCQTAVESLEKVGRELTRCGG